MISLPTLMIFIFSIVCCSYASAQKTVCSGDTVVLILTGYEGNIQWQQSPDLISWSPASPAIGVNGDSLSFIATNDYYYRAEVTDGVCPPFYSDTMLVAAVTCGIAPYCTYNSACNGDIIDNRDNKTYKTIQIINQCWMAENLNVGIRIDGVNNQTSGSDNQNTSIEKYCYSNNPANCTIYGGLYQWDEMMAYDLPVSGNDTGPQGICPSGWHIPTDNEWKCLEMNLGMTQSNADSQGLRGPEAGGKLKQTGTTLWASPNRGATNSSGFSGFPGGMRYSNDSLFYQMGMLGYWWSATEFGNDFTWLTWYRYLINEFAHVDRNPSNKANGFSVRCVKD